MKVFTHGSIYNFQESAREMFISDLEQLIANNQRETTKMLLGTIDIHKEELHLYGTVNELHFDLKNNLCVFRFQLMEGEKREISHSLDELAISHDATFDVLDESDREVRYQVIYLTFRDRESDEETSYFLAGDGGSVQEPLACVMEFWQQVWEIGRGVDFTVSGCRAKAFCKT